MPKLSDYLKVKLGWEVNCRGLSQHMAVLTSYSRSLSSATLIHAIEELSAVFDPEGNYCSEKNPLPSDNAMVNECRSPLGNRDKQ